PDNAARARRYRPRRQRARTSPTAPPPRCGRRRAEEEGRSRRQNTRPPLAATKSGKLVLGTREAGGSMGAVRHLVKLGDFARQDALPWARGFLHKVEGAVGAVLPPLLRRELEDRLRYVSREIAPNGVDPFGWDPEYSRFVIAAAAALSRSYFRTIVSGLENL